MRTRYCESAHVLGLPDHTGRLAPGCYVMTYTVNNDPLGESEPQKFFGTLRVADQDDEVRFSGDLYRHELEPAFWFFSALCPASCPKPGLGQSLPLNASGICGGEPEGKGNRGGRRGRAWRTGTSTGRDRSRCRVRPALVHAHGEGVAMEVDDRRRCL